MTDIIKLALALTVVALIAGMAIAFTHSKTADKIELRQQEARTEALRAVFPEGVEIEAREGSSPLPESYWVAEQNGETVGYAFQASSRGYSSMIEVMVGISPEGTILGLTILSQNETPGLGTRVAEIVSDKYLWNGLGAPKEGEKPWFTEQFAGLDATRDIEISKTREWHKASAKERRALKENNAITAITGATVSTKAIAAAVEKDVSRYARALREQSPDEDTGMLERKMVNEAPEESPTAENQ
ncbi:MAG: FMN-binding protein [Chitinivibrionales bacterium]|nr:FMN-binding protein [Chitinivibrionales bacterium]MBD3357904.1 FMN-binding protein [Chitinivibrionales bacterium]